MYEEAQIKLNIQKDVSLLPFSWWKTGGCAEYFFQPSNLEDVQQALLWAEENKQTFSVVGGGTNILINDQGVKGLVISTEKLNKMQVETSEKHLTILAEAGVLKSEVMACFKKQNLLPALFLSGLPGNVGGGMVMNAGAGSEPPCEFSHIVTSLDVVTSTGLKHYKKEDITWLYRQTKGWQKGVIFQVEFSWPLQQDKDLSSKMKQALKKKTSQPTFTPSKLWFCI